MALIGALNVYPVKSCKGIAVPEADLADSGLRFDLRWVVTDLDGRFVTRSDGRSMVAHRPIAAVQPSR
jgi:uncharacterized protein YcbX